MQIHVHCTLHIPMCRDSQIYLNLQCESVADSYNGNRALKQYKKYWKKGIQFVIVVFSFFFLVWPLSQSSLIHPSVTHNCLESSQFDNFYFCPFRVCINQNTQINFGKTIFHLEFSLLSTLLTFVTSRNLWWNRKYGPIGKIDFLLFFFQFSSSTSTRPKYNILFFFNFRQNHTYCTE